VQHDQTTGPDVITIPPLIPLAGLVLSLVGRMLWKLPILPRWLSGPRKRAGIALIAGGITTAIWGVRTFQEAGTHVSPEHAATALVESGPFQYSRNPLYISMSAVYSGITLLLNNMWGVLLLPAVIAVLQRGVIEREEEHMRARFGDAYEAYTRRVPRWL
jgi:protein-S-isoprenylcysteine O-methyltransferase Ste14